MPPPPPASTTASPLFLGLDLSTQALKASLLDNSLAVLDELEVRFDRDLPHHATKGGVLAPQPGDPPGTVVAPVLLYVEALDRMADKIKQKQWAVDRIRGISAAGQQHASVYFSRQAPSLLASLSPAATLADQLPSAFSRDVVPNWQDSSTAASCAAFEHLYPDGARGLARVTGSRAHTRFTGPQIHAWRQSHPHQYKDTHRIALVSSFVTTLLCAGRGNRDADASDDDPVKPIDESDACGMNLWDMRPDSEHTSETKGSLEPGWNWELLRLVSGESERGDAGEADDLGGAAELERKLGVVARDTGRAVGKVGQWWVERYGFHPDCDVFPGTGDNPATFLAFSLAEGEAIVSLGTSDTVMVSTAQYVPHPEFHAFVHPAKTASSSSLSSSGGGSSSSSYFNMLVYKSGSLAREWVRDEFCESSWDRFNADVESTRLEEGEGKEQRVGFYWLRPEIIPDGASGVHRYARPTSSSAGEFTRVPSFSKASCNASAILETQFLNYRHRSLSIVSSPSSSSASPRSTPTSGGIKRLYAVGGASSNPVICQVLSDVFGSDVVKPVQPVAVVDQAPGAKRWTAAHYNFCSVGAAYKAIWGWHRSQVASSSSTTAGAGAGAVPQEFDAFIKSIKSRSSSSPSSSSSSSSPSQHDENNDDEETQGGVQVVAHPRPDRTAIYDSFVAQWKTLEDRAVRGE
ncbi:uncharacterized protein PFL1_05634 [Pseudozyma flocculosa PF-1]|uniref:Xylulose kinase n=2 Tax=Pseudozyma flocculosa TaxID=84751 RepID=A0A5C3FFB8_9BASI|nr:uncharacterized protein PFL1_05634 [Pseudozyma flocculosa PF-1]EPQ26654.1 hypothetical protein PFL1_05634 [Pseudozyma flocculosa PF-1]SPO42181.1 related to XKS1 - xylulokinase [Pseudozyma flocculosa]